MAILASIVATSVVGFHITGGTIWQKEIPRLINDYSVVPSERTIDAPSPWARSAATAVQQFDEAIRLVTWLYEFRDFQGFARLASWPLEPRRTMIAELQSMRRLDLTGIAAIFDPGAAFHAEQRICRIIVIALDALHR